MSTLPHGDSPRKTRFYRQAESAAAQILEAFQSGNLPKALAPVFVRRRDNVPCRAWSWSNQLLVALAGHSDARGYRQWQEVDRHVKKGEKSFHILVPCVGKRTEKDPGTGEEVERTFIYRFTFLCTGADSIRLTIGALYVKVCPGMKFMFIIDIIHTIGQTTVKLNIVSPGVGAGFSMLITISITVSVISIGFIVVP